MVWLNLGKPAQNSRSGYGRVSEQLSRLNDNLERLLQHLGVPSADVLNAPGVPSLYVGEADDELIQALKEHAELRGMEWKPLDGSEHEGS